MPRRFWEPIFITVSVLVQSYFLRDLLFDAKTTLAHDNFYWNYPLFHYFAETLLQGQIPFWNPYSHAGEPFYPIWPQMRLLDPITLITIFVGRFFTTDLTLLFNWHKYLMSLFAAVTTYLALRPFAPGLHLRGLLFSAALWGSIFLAGFRADGALHSFLWLPALFFFSMDFLRPTPKLSALTRNLGFALSLGINFQSYFFAVTLLWLGSLFVGTVIFYRSGLRYAKARLNRKSLALILGLLFLFSLPNLTLWQERERFVYPVRQVSSETQTGGAALIDSGQMSSTDSLRMDYSSVARHGSFGNFWNLLQLVAPEGNGNLHSERNGHSRFGSPSEIFLFLGLIPFFFAIRGLLFLQSPWDRIFALSLGLQLIFYLGPSTPLYRPFFEILPPLWFLRHTEVFGLGLVFLLLYFSLCGATGKPGWRRETIWLACIALFLGLVSVHHPRPLSFLGRSSFSLALAFIYVWSRGRFVSSLVLWVSVIGLLSGFQDLEVLYRGTPNPHHLLGVSEKPVSYRLSKYRELSVPFPEIFNRHLQAMRYAELVFRRPVLYSVLHEAGPGESLQQHAEGRTWNSYLQLKSFAEHLRAESPVSSAADWGITAPVLHWSGKTGTFEVIKATSQSLALKVTSDTAGQLRWSEMADPFWEVKIDDKFQSLIASPFLKLEVPAGAHEIFFRYRPWPWILASAAFLFAAWFSILLLLWKGSFFSRLIFHHQSHQAHDGNHAPGHKENRWSLA